MVFEFFGSPRAWGEAGARTLLSTSDSGSKWKSSCLPLLDYFKLRSAVLSSISAGSDVNGLTRGTFKEHWILLCVIKLLCATTISRTRCGRNGSMVLEFSEMRIGGVRPSPL